MDLQLQGKTAFISGSTQGIGFAIAKQLLKEGAHVIINGRTSQKIDTAMFTLRKEFPSATISGIAADFTKGQEIKELIERLPAIDILVNNVGLFELKEFTEITDSDWQNIFEVNVLSGIRLSRALLPGMLNNNEGRIIFISSEAGINIPSNMIHYGMTKTAMISVSRGLAEMTKNTKVTVNSIIGGPTYSEGVATAVEQLASSQNQSIEEVKNGIMQHLNPTSLLQRFIDPSEIASLTTYLCSPMASATNGAALRADGGVLNSIL
ncbi:oxidoreductase [Marivirga lumbricoides]|uniref:Oxidoreductase n=1 Tax=Marivirga lumbricoides TaxID=1046115 RepID=A0A2T4DTF4_9BACT|nr:oxidoreductase [Marivirga lumbricoides]